MRAVSWRRTRPTIALPAEVILETLARCWPQRASVRGNVVPQPVRKGPSRGVGIVRDDREAPRTRRRIGHGYRRRSIIAVAGELFRHRLAIRKCGTHDGECHGWAPWIWLASNRESEAFRPAVAVVSPVDRW